MTEEEYHQHQLQEAKWAEYFTNKKLECSNEIKSRFLEPATSVRTEALDNLFLELATCDFRSLIIVGTAYIEELCKECFFSTLIDESLKDFKKSFGTVITFSFTSNSLYAQDYISKEILELITLLRKVRNDLAHNAILSPDHQKSIKSRVEEIKKKTNDRMFSRFDRYLKAMDDDRRICFVLLEMLCYSLIALNVWIIPDEKLAKIIYTKEYPFMRVYLWIDKFNPNYTVPKFEAKYKSLK